MKQGDLRRGGQLPLIVGVLALTPSPTRTPWWAKNLQYSHIILLIGDYCWSQPIKGIGRCYPLLEYAEQAGTERECCHVALTIEGYDPAAFEQSLRRIANRKGQRIRTLLRHLHLWPWKPWNCTSPIREVLNALDIPCEEETPDGIINELQDPAYRGADQ
jgi:hypothetical protein